MYNSNIFIGRNHPSHPINATNSTTVSTRAMINSIKAHDNHINNIRIVKTVKGYFTFTLAVFATLGAVYAYTYVSYQTQDYVLLQQPTEVSPLTRLVIRVLNEQQ